MHSPEKIRRPPPIRPKPPKALLPPTLAQVEHPPFTVPYGPTPMLVYCPHCRAFVKSSVEYVSGDTAWISLFCLTPCLLCWLPCVMDSFKDVEHSCTRCHKKIGYFKRDVSSMRG